MSLRSESLSADVQVTGRERTLVLRAADLTALEGFEGRRGDADGQRILEATLSARNAAALRNAFPNLQPRPLGTSTSAGVGDRLGLATEGHVRAFRMHGQGVTPVFAQQSIREMDRLGRSPQSILDDATFGCVAGGWTGAVGADLDHIRTVQDIDRGIAAGFTTFTLDPGDAVRDATASETDRVIESTDWQTLESDIDSTLRRYAGGEIDLGASALTPTNDDVLHAVVKYANAIALILKMYRHVESQNPNPFETEIAIDETAVETSLFEHHYIASELHRLGMHWVSMAPRYIDGFEKGLDYIGDADALVRNFGDHHAIAELHGGYKISMHSGSDKFSVYAQLVDVTRGRIHLKTSGTSWLTAVDIIARHDPALFRDIYRLSRTNYVDARSSYQVSAEAERAPLIDEVTDTELAALVAAPDSRQILHVGYGAVLTAAADVHGPSLDSRISEVLITHHADYAQALETHIGRHLAPFSEGAAK